MTVIISDKYLATTRRGKIFISRVSIVETMIIMKVRATDSGDLFTLSSDSGGYVIWVELLGKTDSVIYWGQ